MPQDVNVNAWQKEHPWEPSPSAHPEPVPLVSPADLVNPMLTVADAMTANPRSCSPFSTVVEAALIFRDADCGLIPVTEENRPIGVLTDRDLALALANRNGNLAGVTVGDLMARDVTTIAATETLNVALDRLGAEGVRRLLVVDAEGNLAGILSWTDLVPHVSERALGAVVARIVANR